MCYCVSDLKEEVKPLRGREGQTVTLHTGLAKLQSDAKILWIFGPDSPDIFIVESLQVFRGEIITEYKGRFQGRLQLDRETGSLTVRNLTINDAGLYQLQVISELVTYHNFIFTVYGECVLYQSKRPVFNQHRTRSVFRVKLFMVNPQIPFPIVHDKCDF